MKIWAGGVVERIGDHGFDDGDVIGDGCQMRKQLAEFRAALAVLGELELGAKERRTRD